jgi:hypothetical protein
MASVKQCERKLPHLGHAWGEEFPDDPSGGWNSQGVAPAQFVCGGIVAEKWPMGDLPDHFPITVDAEGRGPVNSADTARIECWCGQPGCLRHAIEYTQEWLNIAVSVDKDRNPDRYR